MYNLATEKELNVHRKPEADFWLRLDNAAKIYPAIKDKELTSVFRISVRLKDRIKAKPFVETIQAVNERFPYYKVILKTGFFWYYLQSRHGPVPVEVDKGIPCRAFGKHELMFRVLVYKHKISVEFSHIITDGTGAFEYLKTLLLTYFEKCGLAIPEDISFYNPKDMPSIGEYEDGYMRYFKKIGAKHIKITDAYHVPFALQGKPRFSVLTAIIPLNAVLKKAKEWGVSLTEYLTAVYLYALQDIYDHQSPIQKGINRKILRIEVPVNLRKLYPSKTMRNFSLYVLPGVDLRLGHFTFEEMVKVVFHKMRLETDRKLINKMISRNVGGEKNAFLRSLPLFIKSVFLSKLYTIGTRQYSGVITNLGKIDFGSEINGLIDRFAFTPPPPNRVLKVNCGVAGFGNQLVLCFGNITTSKELERLFLTQLVDQGVPVKLVNTNQ